MSQISAEICGDWILKTTQVIQSVELSTIAHATDDLDKVSVALSHLLPDSLRGRQLFTRQYLEGHFNNPIITFTARLTVPSDVEEFSKFLLSQLPKPEKLSIQRDLNLHSDSDGNLYLRINKQKALLGAITLNDEDPIRVKLKFTRFGGDVTDRMAEYLESI
jgi:RNA binding exosome subunit